MSPWPLKLEPGDAISIVAPSGPFEPEKFKAGLDILRGLGFKPKIPADLAVKKTYLAGSDQHRGQTLAAAMEDKETKAVMAARGGYGAMRLLEGLADKWPLWPPKPLIGFSDITALHLGRLKAGGPIAYHAPVVTSLPLASLETLRVFKDILLNGPAGVPQYETPWVLKAGQARGPVLGGNLTLLTHLLASNHLPDFTKAILMVEDIAEPAYKLDRFFTALRLSGMLGRLAGLALGYFHNCGPEEEVRQVLAEVAADFAGPVVFNLPFGHYENNWLLPLGADMFLEAGPDSARLSLLS